ncbi:MAG: hypothetical protein EAZ61_07975 [Oscillatoriales cyanobacterium]|nr:MAG: hypothetical protein EAZ61_07975 [Oscillatoriales cyanobacterium]
MRSLSNSFLRSRVLWRLLAVAGILIVPLPSLGSSRSTPEFPADPLIPQLIAQTETDSEPPPDASGEATGTTSEATDETINLQLGDTDPRILEIQRLLGIAGYYEGEPTGIFDISTNLAVSRFQESQSLEPDGVVDPTTWKRLQALDPSSNRPKTTSESSSASPPTAQATNSKPKAGAGGFRKLMLGLSLLIVTIGIVGTVFYWLLRLFEGNNSEADADDFDELPPDPNLDSPAGELAHEATEPNLSQAIPDLHTPLNVLSPSATTPEAQPSPVSTEQAVASTSIPDPLSSPEPGLIPPHLSTSTPTEPPRPVTDSPIASPTPTPTTLETPPATLDQSISMASLPVTSPTPVVTRASSVNSAIDTSVSSDIVTTKVSIMEHLLQDLHHPEPSQRKKAIWELGRRGDSRAIRPLVDLMLQSDSQQRSLILAVLAEINTRSLEPMQQALALSFQDDSPEVRKNALRDLTRIFDSMSQMGYFISASVHDRDPSVRETAKWAMTQLERIRSSAGLDHQLPDDRQPPP